MATTSTTKPDFMPPESIIAFVFIGVVAVVGLIASIDQQFDSISDSRDQKSTLEDPVTPARVQRGPKNL
jgi:hypothetical protein